MARGLSPRFRFLWLAGIILVVVTLYIVQAGEVEGMHHELVQNEVIGDDGRPELLMSPAAGLITRGKSRFLLTSSYYGGYKGHCTVEVCQREVRANGRGPRYGKAGCCNNHCIDLFHDTRHCGACGRRCSPGLSTSVARGRAGTSTAATGSTAVDVSTDVDMASDVCLACVDTTPMVVVVVHIDLRAGIVLLHAGRVLRTVAVVVLPKLLRHQNLNLVLASRNHLLAGTIVRNLHLDINRNLPLAMITRNFLLAIDRNLALGIIRNLRLGINSARGLDMVEDIIITITDRPAAAGPSGIVTAEVLRPPAILHHLALGVDHNHQVVRRSQHLLHTGSLVGRVDHHHHLAILDTVSQFIAGLVVTALMAAHLAIPSRSLTTLMAGGRKQYLQHFIRSKN